MDVGCGTGIFSLMAARAGAAHVISFDWSNIVKYTKRIVKDNSLDHIITVIKGKIDSVRLPQGIEKVDVIISMWVGYNLFQGGNTGFVIFIVTVHREPYSDMILNIRSRGLVQLISHIFTSRYLEKVEE